MKGSVSNLREYLRFGKFFIMTNVEREPISLPIREAKAVLGLSDTKTIYGLIAKGKLKAVKVGNKYLVSYASIKKLVES